MEQRIFLQFAIAALVAGLVALLHDGSALPMALGIAGCGLAAMLAALFSLRPATPRQA